MGWRPDYEADPLDPEWNARAKDEAMANSLRDNGAEGAMATKREAARTGRLCGEGLQLRIKPLSGGVLAVNLEYGDGMGEIEIAVWERTGVPPEYQCLLARGNRLGMGCQVGQEGLQAGDTIRLVARLRGGLMRSETGASGQGGATVSVGRLLKAEGDGWRAG